MQPARMFLKGEREFEGVREKEREREREVLDRGEEKETQRTHREKEKGN